MPLFALPVCQGRWPCSRELLRRDPDGRDRTSSPSLTPVPSTVTSLPPSFPPPCTRVTSLCVLHPHPVPTQNHRGQNPDKNVSTGEGPKVLDEQSSVVCLTPFRPVVSPPPPQTCLTVYVLSTNESFYVILAVRLYCPSDEGVWGPKRRTNEKSQHGSPTLLPNPPSKTPGPLLQTRRIGTAGEGRSGVLLSEKKRLQWEFHSGPEAIGVSTTLSP